MAIRSAHKLKAEDAFIESAPHKPRRAKAAPPVPSGNRIRVIINVPPDVLALVDDHAPTLGMTRSTFFVNAAIKALKDGG